MVYFLTGQPLEIRRMVMFYSIAIMVLLVSESFGMVVASRLSVLVRKFFINRHGELTNDFLIHSYIFLL